MDFVSFSPEIINTKTHPHLASVTKYWQSKDKKYEVMFDEINGFKHLRIRRFDNKPIRNFMVIQEIKNDLLGKDVIAVEIFPKQSDFIDGSNTYHLWTWDGISVPNLKELYQYKKEPIDITKKFQIIIQNNRVADCSKISLDYLKTKGIIK